MGVPNVILLSSCVPNVFLMCSVGQVGCFVVFIECRTCVEVGIVSWTKLNVMTTPLKTLVSWVTPPRLVQSSLQFFSFLRIVSYKDGVC